MTSSECSSLYTRIICRNFTTWYQEHLPSFKYKKTISSIVYKQAHTFPKLTDTETVNFHNSKLSSNHQTFFKKIATPFP